MKFARACSRSLLAAIPPFVCVAVAVVASCAAPATRAAPNDEWHHGYSILHRLLSDESNVNKILWIKRESRQLGDLLEEIAKLCRDSKEKLEAWDRENTEVDLAVQPLPVIEQETRDSIADETAATLVRSSGSDFELRMLLTQVEALRYMSHLCRVLGRRETLPAQREFLADLDRRAVALMERALELVLSRNGARSG